MINKVKWVFLLLFLTLITSTSAWAQSYVLPYPSSMPGSFLYKFHKTYESISKYWHFGEFASFKYNLKYADKYLIEAKTLFEYNQHLLAYKALENSNYYFSKIPDSLKEAKLSGKNTKEKEDIFREASKKHIEILNLLREQTPESFVWTPEKENASNLFIHKLIGNSIKLRQNVL